MKQSKEVSRHKQWKQNKVNYESLVKIDTCFSQEQSRKTDRIVKKEHQKQNKIKQENFQVQQMRNIKEKILLKNVNKNLKSLIALKIKPQKINLFQQWQNKDNLQLIDLESNHESVKQIFKLFYPFVSWYNLLQGILVIIFLWLISISVVFQQKLGTIFFIILNISVMIQIIIQTVIMIKDKHLQLFSIITKIDQLSHPLILFSASSLMILRNITNIDEIEKAIQIFIVIIFFYLLNNISHYFQPLLIFAQKNKVIKQLRIIQAFSMLFGIAHLFGLFIYSSKYISPYGKKTWLVQSNLQNQTWVIQYIYSVYWAITTIVTVGYGDLSPMNHVQVLMIMIVQVVGTSYFGYMINVIGIAVFKINKKNEEYDNYQQTISKLKDHYQLSDQLCYEMKKDIKQKYTESHKIVSLKNNQELQFLQYIDSTVKKNFIHQTNIKIIKKSLFFLTYFTVDCQNHIALKLIRIIYKKDEKITVKNEKNNQRNIVIVNNGKVSMFIQNKIFKRKIVKTIQPIEGEPTLNVIGFTSLILDRDIDLTSEANIMTSVYALKRSDLLQSIQKNIIDYESFHEMRQKMLIINFKQSIQAPVLSSFEYHFLPNKYILIRKNSRKYHQNRSKGQRSTQKKCLFFVDNNKAEKLKKWLSVIILASYKQQQISLNKQKRKKSSVHNFDTLLSVQSSVSRLRNKHTTMIFEQKQNQQDILKFDQVKIFQHFMINYNIDMISASYQKSCGNKSYKKRILSKNIKRQFI